METPPNLQVYDLGHLGLVASVLDRIRLVQTVDRLVGPRPGEKVSTGMALKAALLNALGFVASPSTSSAASSRAIPPSCSWVPASPPTSSTTTVWAGCWTPWSPGCSWRWPGRRRHQLPPPRAVRGPGGSGGGHPRHPRLQPGEPPGPGGVLLDPAGERYPQGGPGPGGGRGPPAAGGAGRGGG